MRLAAKLVLVLVLAASLAAATTVGFAAGIGGLAPTALAGDSASVAACDADGFADSYTVVGGLVTQVTLSDIADPGCEGGALSVVLADSSGSSIAAGTATLTADGDTAANSVTVALDPDPAKGSVAAIHVAVTGP